MEQHSCRLAGLILGTLLLGLSFYLAIGLRFKHFYELTLLGLAIAQGALLRKKLLSGREYEILWAAFLVIGFLGDLLLGRIIGKLWYYTYTHWYEYLVLYIWTYPLGGIVMVQAFLLLSGRSLTDRAKAAFPHPGYSLRNAGIGFILASLGLGILWPIYRLPYHGLWIATSATLALFFLLNWDGERAGESYIRHLLAHPVRVPLTTVAATYLQAFIHEFPNHFARQWVYTNWPLQGWKIFGVPVMVLFAGWLVLLLIPISQYFSLKGRLKRSEADQVLPDNKSPRQPPAIFKTVGAGSP